VLIVLVSATGVVVAKTLRSRMQALPELRTVKIERRDLCITVGTTGTVEPEEIVEIGAEVAGRIVRFGREIDDPDEPIGVGSHVTKDTVLVQLDSQLYELAIQKAQAARRLAEADGRMVHRVDGGRRVYGLANHHVNLRAAGCSQCRRNRRHRLWLLPGPKGLTVESH